MQPDTKIAIFKGKGIRKTVHNNEWWFVIVDVVAALTDSVQPEGDLKDMRRRDPELSKGWGQIATPLPFQTEGGQQKLNCANTEGVFRIVRQCQKGHGKTDKKAVVSGHNYLQEKKSQRKLS